MSARAAPVFAVKKRQKKRKTRKEEESCRVKIAMAVDETPKAFQERTSIDMSPALSFTLWLSGNNISERIVDIRKTGGGKFSRNRDGEPRGTISESQSSENRLLTAAECSLSKNSKLTSQCTRDRCARVTSNNQTGFKKINILYFTDVVISVKFRGSALV